MTTNLLDIADVTKVFAGRGGESTWALAGVTLQVAKGETVAIIGESGSGKSTLGRVALGLLSPDEGTVHVHARALQDMSRQQLAGLRSRMTVVFQEPLDALNPRMRVWDLIGEPLKIHGRNLNRRERWSRVLEAMDQARLERRLWDRYPGDLSGGQQQRVGIARAVATRPDLIILDEPTASLDMSVRGQILATLQDLQGELGVGYLFISHDISTVRSIADRVVVMYRGTVVETGPRESIFGQPRHPYTHALLSANLSTDPGERLSRLKLTGDIPPTHRRPEACVLSGRCPIEIDACSDDVVPLRPVGDHHYAACIRHEEIGEDGGVLADAGARGSY